MTNAEKIKLVDNIISTMWEFEPTDASKDYFVATLNAVENVVNFSEDDANEK